MKFWTTTLGLLITVAAIGVTARADDTSDIHALFYKLARSMSAKDSSGVMAVGTSDLTYIEKGRVLSGNQIAEHMERRFRLMEGTPRCRFQVLSMQIKGRNASVLTSDFTEAEVSGATGRMHKVIATGRSRDELVKSKRGWLLKTVIVQSSSMTMDGKQLPGSILGGAR
jgi:ketosteroid isomerase-like protein